jgi:hypothetical protein
MRTLLLPLSIVIGLAGGCYSEAGYSVGYGAPVPAGVYFSDGAYWRHDGGVWYQSPRWDRGWAVSYRVPVHVREHYRVAHYRR